MNNDYSCKYIYDIIITKIFKKKYNKLIIIQ